MSSGANYRTCKPTEKAAALQKEKEQREKKKTKKKKPSNKQAAEASSEDSSDKEETRRQVKHCHVPEEVEIGGDSSDNEPEIVKIGYNTTEEEAGDTNGNEESEVQLMKANVSNITACVKKTQTHLRN